MLHQTAFANAIAILTAAFSLVFYLLNFVAPPVFEFLFNAQFLGADVASLLPKDYSSAQFLSILAILTALGWVAGYVLAWLYNRFAK